MERGPIPAEFGPRAEDLPEEGRLYRHWKGDLYRIICVSRSSEERAKILVTYRSMLKQTNWTRHLEGPEGFNEMVTWPDGKQRRRFVPEAQITLEALQSPLV